MIQTGDRVLFRAEAEVRAYRQLGPTWRRDEDGVGARRNIDHQPEVICLSTRKRNDRKSTVDSAVAGINISRRIEAYQRSERSVCRLGPV